MTPAQPAQENAPRALVNELRGISVFEDLPEADLEWLATRMTVDEFRAGDVVIEAGSPADKMVIVLQGDLQSSIGSGNDLRVFQAHAGTVTGMLPFSRLTHFPGTTRAMTHLRLARLRVEYFPEMLERMPVLGQRLVALMSDRIRELTRQEQQREKMAALGKLSAGLAHELNNPAAAARRAAAELRNAIESLRLANVRLEKRAISTEQRAMLGRLDCEAMTRAAGVKEKSALERSDAETELSDWLEEHGVSYSWQMAPALVEAGFNTQSMTKVAEQVPADALGDVLTRLTASNNVLTLIDEIEQSAARVSELVQAIKEYSYMDQMTEQEIDVHDGIESTLTILRNRLKYGVTIERDYDRRLPRICARGSELNQVWTNLIDNAADAMHGKGTLTIGTAREQDRLLVTIEDTGDGIPPEIQSRIFEPFFTTKDVGEGLGLGLDTVYRVVHGHRGDIRFQSKPGETRFEVRLPFMKSA